MLTDFLGLTLTAESETSMTFLQWRTLMNGVNCNSNMELIDRALSALSTTVANKADGFTLDPETGVLQLTSGGDPIDGASVTINLNKYYTKDEVDSFMDELEKSLQASISELEESFANNDAILAIQQSAIGDLSWDESTRALTMYNLNGEQVGDTITIEGGGGGSGGGAAYSIRLSNGMPSTTITAASSSKTVLKATFYEYYGTEETNVAGSMTASYKLSTASEWKDFATQIVYPGVEFSVDVTDILTTDKATTVRITVTGGESGLSRALNYNVTQVEASISAINFDIAAVYTGNFDFQYKCMGRNLTKTVHFLVDGVEVVSVDVGTSHNTTLTQTIPLLGKTDYGAHDFEVYFTTSDGASSNHLVYSILYNDGTSTAPMIALVPLTTEITYGDSIDVQYVLYTPNKETTDELTIRVYATTDLGEVDYATSSMENIPNNVAYEWHGNNYPDSGETHIEFKSGDTVETVTVYVNEVETEYDLHPVSSNLVYSYSASGRSNNDSNKSLYECEYTTANGVKTTIKGKFDGLNWVSNGYLDGSSMLLSGGATHTICLPMFLTSYTDDEGQTVNLESSSGATITTNGRTFEVEFQVTNVTDINAKIIQCISDDHAGFVVTPQNCYLLSSNGTDVVLDETGFIENEESVAAAYIKDNKRIRLSFVIEPKGTVQYQQEDGTQMSGQCVNIYINGRYANSYVYPDNAQYVNDRYISMGDESCILNLYDVRIYNRGLTAVEVLQNYMSSPLSVQDRLERLEDNDVLTDDGDVDYYKAIEKYNCLLVTGQLSPYKGANGIKTDGKYECGLTLTKPNGEGGHTTEFNLMDKDVDGVFVSANNVQGTSSVKFPIKNYKVYLAKLNDTGAQEKVKYSLKGLNAEGEALSIPESTLCWKGDYMSSDHANTFNAGLADTLFTDKTPAQEEDPRVQNTVWGFRCLLFQRDDEDSEIKFIGDGALNNDKGNSKTFGLEVTGDSGNVTTRQKWEFLNNTEALCSFQTDKLQEPVSSGTSTVKRASMGLESTYPDQGDLKDAGLSPNYDYIQVMFTWVCQRANFWEASEAKLGEPLVYNGVSYDTEKAYRKAIFLNEFDRHFNRNHVIVYYLFMEYIALCDNRAKNMFIQCMDVTAEHLVNVSGEPMSINDAIDTDTGAVNADMIDWEKSEFAVWYPVLYDLDSCFGVENSGYLQIPYYADWNYFLNGVQKFNGRESVFWLMVEDALASDLQDEAKSLSDKGVGSGGLNYENLYNYHITNNAELVCPAVVNRDMEHKYSDPWTEGYVNYAVDGYPTVHVSDYKYLQRGSRTEQKDSFMYRRCNMIYSKYKCNKFLNNNINFRCGVNGGIAAANSGITMAANQVLYPAVKYGDGDNAVVISGEKTFAGTYATITKPGTSATDRVGFSDTVYIAGGTFLTDIGDISKFQPYELQLQNATGLRSLMVGSATDGYTNPSLKKIDTSGCKLLEEINIMGCTALGTVDLSYNGLLKRVYAGNSSATAVLLPVGGVLEELHLGTVVDLAVLNHENLQVFECDSYDNITSLRVEGTPNIPTLEIVTQRLAKLSGGLRLVGIDWTVSDTDILERLISSESRGKYIDNNGTLSSDRSAYPYISGTVHVDMIGTYLMSQLNAIYPDLNIEACSVVQQYSVEFRNYDETVLDKQYVYQGGSAEDPVTRSENPITTPTRESTVSTDYTFSGWDGTFSVIQKDTVIYAMYDEKTRSYTVNWYNGTTMLQSTVAEYGTGVEYEGETPTDTSQEAYLVYRLFDGWDNNTFFVGGDIDVHAKFTEATAPTDKKLSDMTPTELYALVKTGVLSANGANNTIIASGDTIDLRLGCDYEFDNVESHEFVSVESPMVFDGSNYLNTGVKLFDEDKSFVLAIDFKYASTSDSTSSLVSCYERNGFILKSNTNPYLMWGSAATVQVASSTTREMVVIRHKAGDTNLYVYASNRAADSIIEQTLVNSLSTKNDAPLSFGANIQSDGYIDAYAKGTVYWAKLWMSDLGEGACRNIASWTRNTVTMQAAGNAEYSFRTYTRADNSRYVNCCFMTENLLDIGQQMNATNTNAGGWKDSRIRKWCNSRLYMALPEQWRLLMLQFNVMSANGGNTQEVNTTADYVAIPSCRHMGFNTDTAPYANEAEATFNLFSNYESRIKKQDNGDGQAYPYRLLSPAQGFDTHFHSVSETGTLTYIYTAGYSAGVCFVICI